MASSVSGRLRVGSSMTASISRSSRPPICGPGARSSSRCRSCPSMASRRLTSPNSDWSAEDEWRRGADPFRWCFRVVLLSSTTSFDTTGRLVTAQGAVVQGWAADAQRIGHGAAGRADVGTSAQDYGVASLQLDGVCRGVREGDVRAGRDRRYGPSGCGGRDRSDGRDGSPAGSTSRWVREGQRFHPCECRGRYPSAPGSRKRRSW